jgi:hypothetical protein
MRVRWNSDVSCANDNGTHASEAIAATMIDDRRLLTREVHPERPKSVRRFLRVANICVFGSSRLLPWQQAARLLLGD